MQVDLWNTRKPKQLLQYLDFPQKKLFSPHGQGGQGWCLLTQQYLSKQTQINFPSRIQPLGNS